MFARVQCAVFKPKLMKLTDGSRCSVNFKLSKGLLSMQANLNILVEKEIEVIESDNDSTSFTADIGSVINLLNEKDEVCLQANGDVLSIWQNNFKYDAVRVPEERVDYSGFLQKAVLPFDARDFAKVAGSSRIMDAVAKELGGVKANINIVRGYAYIEYSNSVFVEPFESLDNVMFTPESVRTLVKFLGGSNLSYYKDDESGMMVMRLDDMSAAVTAFSPDARSAAMCDKYIAEMSDITEIDFGRMKNVLECICRSYKQLTVEFIIREGGFGIYVDDITAKFATGYGGKRLCSIKLSLGQVSAMYRLFAGSSACTVAVGGNKICLKQKNSRKKLVLAGLVF